MKKYLAVFVAPTEAYDKVKSRTPEEQKDNNEKWAAWMEAHKADFADMGGPVGKTKRVSEGGEVTDARNEIGGYMVVQAENADDAAGIFKDSPSFGDIGGAIEVMEIMEM
jgi:hypothetical protein